MLLHVYSDCHFEHMRLPYMEFWINVDELLDNEQSIAATASLHGEPEQKPIAILAGDIVVWNYEAQARAALSEFVKRYGNRVVYIPGNHEYYASKVGLVESKIESMASELGFTYLSPGKTHTIDGQRFVGATLWYSQSFTGGIIPARGDRPPREGRIYRFSDFRFIEGFDPWVYQQHASFLDWCKVNLLETDIVLTHHMPSAKSVHTKWKGDITNCFFYTDLENLIKAKQPKFWVHGHTHSPFDYHIDKTRVYCNPFGYPNENANPGFWTRVVVDL